MASISASGTVPSPAQIPQKPSFAKIASAGLKSTNGTPQIAIVRRPDQVPDLKSSQTETPSPSNPLKDTQPAPALASTQQHEQSLDSASPDPQGLQVHIQGADLLAHNNGTGHSEGLLAPGSADDAGTQMSSSNGSVKPPSLDGKSVTSLATFGLDEKESLRPDDSASVKAIEDEDAFSNMDASGAFRDQLREISAMEPAGRNTLYASPQEPATGSGPVIARILPTEQVEILPDPKLLEALENPRDRVWVLKLEQDVIDFVKDAKEPSLNLPQCNSFYRMLAHKMADYYMLGHVVDDSSAVRLFKTPHCRIPPGLTGITTPSTAASTPPPAAPQMKILRRGEDHGFGNGSFGANLDNGESGNEEDKKPKPVSREEREARYEAARLRIMGSAKPSESPEGKDKEESRSSSATGKKNKKKVRNDSDDDFEARGAYSNYFAGGPLTMRTDGIAQTPYEYSADGQPFSPMNYNQPGPPGGFHQQAQMAGGGHWAQQQYQQIDHSNPWSPSQPSPYDLASEFQRSMTLQGHATHHANAGMTHGTSHAQGYYPNQSAWPQQQFSSPGQSPMGQPGYGQGFMPSNKSMYDGQQSYQFGQLPSQTFPGRLPNKLEHPLPGSYKSRHFNPQSQTFIPGPNNTGVMRPFTPQGPQLTNHTAFASPYAHQLQRQNSTQSQSSAYGSPHINNSPIGSNRPQSHQLTHPLPQRVLPRQSSPSVALPAKPSPGIPQQRSAYDPFSAMTTSNNSSPSHGQYQSMPSASVISMYGAPSSLPAKPPVASAEASSYDAAKMSAVNQQRPSHALPAHPIIASRAVGSSGYASSQQSMSPLGVGAGSASGANGAAVGGTGEKRS